MTTHVQTTRLKLNQRTRELALSISITLGALIILILYVMPLIFGIVTSLKTQAQAAEPNAPIIPMEIITFDYQGETLEVFAVPFADGTRELALLQPRRSASLFVDPANPQAEPIEWEGNWRQLDPVREVNIKWGNYQEAWETINFLRLLANTLGYALITMIGTVVASSMVAYGFARFRFPGKDVLFVVLLATIILPPAVTLVPTYAFFVNVLGWGGTWLPLIVPQMFGNAYNVFLLRQYFLTIPREMEEAATIDGAGPIQTFLQVILPQAKPALTAVALFHFFFAWNDFFGPLIYLAGNAEANPISVGLTYFNALYQTRNELVLAAAVISVILPLFLFFIAQRFFIQGIVITGVDK
ncbi:MAG: carbohydrate ABC transporter permease [Phototrophicaceae bacterium]|jgi:multiple sugar transport system permease protein